MDNTETSIINVTLINHKQNKLGLIRYNHNVYIYICILYNFSKIKYKIKNNIREKICLNINYL